MYESLHNLTLGISKMMKRCLLAYVLFGGLVPSRCIWRAVLRGFNLLLSAIQEEIQRLKSRAYSRKGTCLGLEGAVHEQQNGGVLEGKSFEALGIVFPFVSPFVDRSNWEVRHYNMTSAHPMFSELECWLRRKNSKEIVSDELLRHVRGEVQVLKAMVKETFDVLYETSLYTRNFRLPEHITKAVEQFGRLELVNNSACE